MRIIYSSQSDWKYLTGINYKIGDDICDKDNPCKVLGKCTGFTHDESCILVDGECFGGKYFFMKSEWQEIEVCDPKMLEIKAI